MPHINANGVELHYRSSGEGEPVVLVHGGWSDLEDWQPVAGPLSQGFEVVAYDRRGHGGSQRGHQGTRRDQEDDLAGLIEALDLAPAHVVGTSFGGLIAIGLASRRPELFRSVVAHEPPLMSVVADDPEVQPQLAEIAEAIASVAARVTEGDARGAARQFVEEVALGPGSWNLLPDPEKEIMIDSAPAFVDEQKDPDWAIVDLPGLGELRCPAVVTQSDDSPAWFRTIVAGIAEEVEGLEVRTYAGAGHAPHVIDPEQYLATVGPFLSRAGERVLALP